MTMLILDDQERGNTAPSASDLRTAILAAPLETHSFCETPVAGSIYLSPSHLKALRLDAHVVVGGRGVGKSFWTSVLQSDTLRATVIEKAIPEMAGVTVRLGFSEKENIDIYPNADVFSRFLDQGGDPYELWRAVILRWIAEKSGQPIPRESWSETVDWLKNNPEDATKLMQQRGNWRGLIVFDALDRSSNNWERMDDIVRGLLRAVVWLKSFQGLYAKVFLRKDQAERTVFNFSDSSKLTATKAELTWALHDLHGLLWQRLINAPEPHGEILRKICPHIEQLGFWQVANEMKIKSLTQRKAFECLTGQRVGRNRRRGTPYTWLVSRLSDGLGQISPRSFLAAIQQAAKDTAQCYPDHEYALHFAALERSIQKAAAIRVQEVAEDYSWVPILLSELKGLNVPVKFEIIREIWADKFPSGPQSIFSCNLPVHPSIRKWEEIHAVLQKLGLFETRMDDHIDMPDLYRIGFHLGRKGGIKPI